MIPEGAPCIPSVLGSWASAAIPPLAGFGGRGRRDWGSGAPRRPPAEAPLAAAPRAEGAPHLPRAAGRGSRAARGRTWTGRCGGDPGGGSGRPAGPTRSAGAERGRGAATCAGRAGLRSGALLGARRRRRRAFESANSAACQPAGLALPGGAVRK